MITQEKVPIGSNEYRTTINTFTHTIITMKKITRDYLYLSKTEAHSAYEERLEYKHSIHEQSFFGTLVATELPRKDSLTFLQSIQPLKKWLGSNLQKFATRAFLSMCTALAVSALKHFFFS